jgi:CRP/FNR family cyclic AMP-dependent transcriptional regulator
MPDSLPPTNGDFTEAAADESFYHCKASPELIAAFENRAIKVICSDNQLLFSHGEPAKCVYLVLTGKVRMLLPLTSPDRMGFQAQSGSFIGLPAAFSNEPYSLTALASEGAEVAVMSRDKFCDLIANSPALSLDVLKILAAETRAARIAIVETGMKRQQ